MAKPLIFLPARGFDLDLECFKAGFLVSGKWGLPCNLRKEGESGRGFPTVRTILGGLPRRLFCLCTGSWLGPDCRTVFIFILSLEIFSDFSGEGGLPGLICDLFPEEAEQVRWEDGTSCVDIFVSMSAPAELFTGREEVGREVEEALAGGIGTAGSGRGTIDEVILWMSRVVVSRILIFS